MAGSSVPESLALGSESPISVVVIFAKIQWHPRQPILNCNVKIKLFCQGIQYIFSVLLIDPFIYLWLFLQLYLGHLVCDPKERKEKIKRNFCTASTYNMLMKKMLEMGLKRISSSQFAEVLLHWELAGSGAFETKNNTLDTGKVKPPPLNILILVFGEFKYYCSV